MRNLNIGQAGILANLTPTDTSQPSKFATEPILAYRPKYRFLMRINVSMTSIHGVSDLSIRRKICIISFSANMLTAESESRLLMTLNHCRIVDK
jgi:hypothetical protein